MSYKETLEYLDSLVNYEKTGFTKSDKKFNLDKLKNILAKMGNPQDSFRAVHVAGTKGKGSVSTFISSILTEAGFKVGLFTSPHLILPRERIKLNGDMISEDDLAHFVDELRKTIDDEKETLSYFEVYMLAAILYFKAKKADIAIFEVGIGGRLDATNVINGECSVITPISYDHTDVLGEKLEMIASEKAAIVKPGTRCFSSNQKPQVLDVIRKVCREKNSRLKVFGDDIKVGSVLLEETGSSFNIATENGAYENCRISMAGKFQVANAALSVGAAEEFLQKDKEERERIIKNALLKAYIPGRMEVISKNPVIIIDGAQNEESAEKLKYSVEHIFKYGRLILLLGVSGDKDIKGICGVLGPMADEVILTRSASLRAADPLLLRGYFRKKEARVTGNTKEALGLAFTLAKKNDLILATGSFYVIGEIRQLIV